MPRLITKTCLHCGERPRRSRQKYCSNDCQRTFEYQGYIKKWKNGLEIGLNSIGVVSSHIKRYLREKYSDRCSLCGWSQVNSKTGVVPLIADHIDGNWKNNIESNLRLICPNCDSLSDTYAGLNRGNGRQGRVVSKRAVDARSMIN